MMVAHHPTLAAVAEAAREGRPLTRAELRAWAEARRHYDATREQAAVGAAVLDVLDRLDQLEADRRLLIIEP